MEKEDLINQLECIKENIEALQMLYDSPHKSAIDFGKALEPNIIVLNLLVSNISEIDELFGN